MHMEMTIERKIEIIKILQELDKELNKIRSERALLKKECKDANCYLEIQEIYFGDGEKHWGW